MFFRIRFIPIMIFATALLLSVKVTNIWNDVEGLSTGYVEVSSAVAQTADSNEPTSLTPSGEGGQQPVLVF